MSDNYFKVIRSGINSTFQDKGRSNLYHLGIPFSGAMDNRNYLLANKLVGNKLDSPVIEFAYQGPLLKFNGNKVNIVVTGDVIFKLRKKDNEIDGNCYETYELEHGDEIDILSTNKSVYGYLAISGEFNLKFQWGSCSVNTKSNIGANDGKRLENNQKIEISLEETTSNVLMAIKDEGPGFLETSTQKIFKRFYSNRPKNFGKHSGLGLNIVKNIVELHKGTIAASNRINTKGAQVEVLLPKYS